MRYKKILIIVGICLMFTLQSNAQDMISLTSNLSGWVTQVVTIVWNSIKPYKIYLKDNSPICGNYNPNSDEFVYVDMPDIEDYKRITSENELILAKKSYKMVIERYISGIPGLNSISYTKVENELIRQSIGGDALTAYTEDQMYDALKKLNVKYWAKVFISNKTYGWEKSRPVVSVVFVLRSIDDESSCFIWWKRSLNLNILDAQLPLAFQSMTEDFNNQYQKQIKR